MADFETQIWGFLDPNFGAFLTQFWGFFDPNLRLFGPKFGLFGPNPGFWGRCSTETRQDVEIKAEEKNGAEFWGEIGGFWENK